MCFTLLLAAMVTEATALINKNASDLTNNKQFGNIG